MLRKRKLCMYIEEPDCELYEAIGDTQKILMLPVIYSLGPRALLLLP